MLNDLVAKIRTIDPKLVAAAVAYVLTYAVTDLLNLGLEDKLLGAGALNVTWNQAIAFAAAGAAGWWRSNAGTILRTRQDDGNPRFNPEGGLGRQAGYSLVELGIFLLLLAIAAAIALAVIH